MSPKPRLHSITHASYSTREEVPKLLGKKSEAPCHHCLNTMLASAPTKGHQQSLCGYDIFASWAAWQYLTLFTASSLRFFAPVSSPDILLGCWASFTLSLASASPHLSYRPVFLGIWQQPSPPTRGSTHRVDRFRFCNPGNGLLLPAS